jgi:hypothetical protein
VAATILDRCFFWNNGRVRYRTPGWSVPARHSQKQQVVEKMAVGECRLDVLKLSNTDAPERASIGRKLADFR